MKKTFFFIIIAALVVAAIEADAMAWVEKNFSSKPAETKSVSAVKQTPEINTPSLSLPQSPAQENSTSTPAAVTSSAVRQEIIEYTVKEGDVIGTIAGQFGLKINTILEANNLTATSLIKPGQKLIILPVDGVAYKVQNGDTLSKVAQSFSLEPQKIAEANNLPDGGALKIGTTLVIPGGKPLPAAPKKVAGVKTAKPTKASTKKTTTSKTKTTGSKTTTKKSGVTWTSGALAELNKIPSFVRGSVRAKINAYAASHNIKVITKELYKSIKV